MDSWDAGAGRRLGQAREALQVSLDRAETKEECLRSYNRFYSLLEQCQKLALRATKLAMRRVMLKEEREMKEARHDN